MLLGDLNREQATVTIRTSKGGITRVLPYGGRLRDGILPPGFRRMRHYGILSNFHKAQALHAAKIALKAGPAMPVPKPEPAVQREKVLEQYLGHNPRDCPHCGAKDTILRVAVIPASCRHPPAPAIQAAQFL